MLENDFTILKPLIDFSREYHSNEGLRSRVDGGDFAPVIEALDVDVPQDMEVRVFCNTADTFYLVLQPDPSKTLEDNELVSISGGSTFSTAGSIGTASTVPSCLSSASSAGSVSTAGGG